MPPSMHRSSHARPAARIAASLQIEKAVAAVTLLVQIALLGMPVAVGAVAEAWGVRAAFGCIIPLLALGLVMSRRLH